MPIIKGGIKIVPGQMTTLPKEIADVSQIKSSGTVPKSVPAVPQTKSATKKIIKK